MKRLLLAGLFALALGGSQGSGRVLAQAGTGQYYVPVPQYGVGQRPLLSPYLNMVGPNTGVSGTAAPGLNTLSPLNYYLFTLPEQQRRANQQAVNNELSMIESGQTAPQPGLARDEIAELTTPLSATGHMSYFNASGGYFNNNRASIAPTFGFPQQQRMQQQQFMRR